ncbi:MAG: phosphatidate cytidylyltransferase [Rhodocyclaceae bacterium]
MMLAGVKPTLLLALGGILGILVAATVIVAVLRKMRPEGNFAELAQRVKSWWVMVAVFSAALLMSRNISIAFFAFVSFLALKEFLSLVPTRRADRAVLLWTYLAIPVQYLWVGQEWYGMFIIFIPVYVFLFLPMVMVVIGETKDFLRAAGTMHWGMMTTVFSLSHLAFLLVLPEKGNPVGGGAGLLLYLVFLTQFNDVLQFVWGKTIGRHKIIPKVSPNKTWEGFLGGLCTTTLLALVIAPYLTPFDGRQALAAGLIIGLSGFIGDVTMSAVKRDIGVKDASNLIPGHGGILDRVDSLTYTAPLFFHFTYYLHF